MDRLARGNDGREWVIRAQMEWRQPATADDFEHDAAANYTPGIIMAVVAVVLAFVLFVSTPDRLVIPDWVPLGVLLIALFFPLRWVLRRPWTVVAETDGDPSGVHPSERWVGTVRGVFNVNGELKQIAKSIARHDLPDFEGPLHPVE
ncbi:hypothetical protein [Prauserella rugosa]|uniref:DUF983 domain-containing protein n=1 Tax=Prauserella rugosa TaxID=43354 RepID=A0A660CEL2_9PSEU|nr:hypothetical protein [Prauserella rugosa]KID32161.1 hypothetical protein HQ32_00022 [Prauserella sp. Am3]KMS88148.1 hypothetical protein ACZ91_27400 [Streptomyces regensis]TWH21842.1 hypothetical protein JD82_03712 [Prauserella rugosa]